MVFNRISLLLSKIVHISHLTCNEIYNIISFRQRNFELSSCTSDLQILYLQKVICDVCTDANAREQATCLKQQSYRLSRVDDGINIQSCSPCVPSAAPLKYDSITLWDKMNRIHHFDVFVRFERVSSAAPQPARREKTPERKRKMQKSQDAVGPGYIESIKRHCLMVSPRKLTTPCDTHRYHGYKEKQFRPPTAFTTVFYPLTGGSIVISHCNIDIYLEQKDEIVFCSFL